MLRPRSFLVVFSFLALACQGFTQTTVQGEPFGYVKINIAPGDGVRTKANTLLSIPLLQDAEVANGKTTGRITSVTSTTISDATAGWASGELSNPSTPRLMEITSGDSAGRLLLLSTATANTANTVTLDPLEQTRVGDLQNMGLEQQTYRLRKVYTLSTFFGTPATTGIRGGSSASNADTVVLVVNGTSQTYFYSTTANKWVRAVFLNPDASNVPLPPHFGVQYSRLDNQSLELVVTGKVPSGRRQLAVVNSGITLLPGYWAADQTLAQLGIESLDSWTRASTAAQADTVVVVADGSASTYFHNGTGWRRSAFLNPPADTTPIPVGASVMLNRRRNTSADFSTYLQQAPYNIQ